MTMLLSFSHGQQQQQERSWTPLPRATWQMMLVLLILAAVATEQQRHTACAFLPTTTLTNTAARRLQKTHGAAFVKRQQQRQLLLAQPQQARLASRAKALYATTSTNSTLTATDWIVQGLENQPQSTKLPAVVGPKRVLIYDTTLRDGTQGESVSASAEDKLKIVRRLAAFDVDYIEAGWPGSNPKDAAFFQRAKTELDAAQKSKLSAFGSTRRKNIAVEKDAQVQALLDSEAPTVCLVAKSDAWQVTDILKATLEENLCMIRETVAHLVAHGRSVMVDMEHFFDGYKKDPDYALQCCQAAVEAGAISLVLCDTNGGTMPWQLGEVVKTVVDKFTLHPPAGQDAVTIGIHCHNDCGMAVANSMMAAQVGAGLIQGTINGIGERTGNANLCSIVPSLRLHVQSELTCQSHLKELTSLSRYVDEILNRTPDNAAPFVGSSAFAHKGGLHVAAMERSPDSYQHISPEAVGNEKRILISELSGRQNIMGKIEEVGLAYQDDPDSTNQRAIAILNHVKYLENQGYTFEGAEASVHLMILHSNHKYCPPFKVLDYSAHVYDSNIDSASRVLLRKGINAATADECQLNLNSSTTRATIKVRTKRPEQNGLENHLRQQESLLPYQDRLEVGEGNGPVDALAIALKRALQPIHPVLETVELVDYKVRILDPESATAAAVRVMIEFYDSATEKSWTTVSVDTNVISASLNALVDGYEYALIEYADSCMLCDDTFE